jgi:hypothetical protein
MAAAARDPAFAKKVGIKQSVAKEFSRADSGTGIIKPKNQSQWIGTRNLLFHV